MRKAKILRQNVQIRPLRYEDDTDRCLPPLSRTNSALCHSQVGTFDLAEGVDGLNYPKHQQKHSSGGLTHEAAQATKE